VRVVAISSVGADTVTGTAVGVAFGVRFLGGRSRPRLGGAEGPAGDISPPAWRTSWLMRLNAGDARLRSGAHAVGVGDLDFWTRGTEADWTAAGVLSVS
jgi:hypothetical protein